MREKLRRFMWGRYGNDNFNRFLMTASLVCLLLSMIFRGPFYLLALGLLAYTYFRMFSRNIAKRSAENSRYLSKSAKVRNAWAGKKREFAQRKQYHIYKCPVCSQKIRVPRGRGRIAITCRKCGNEFIKKS
ncbi:MAG: hypothetical protein ACI4HQ_00370 [Acetatifactor sp.]